MSAAIGIAAAIMITVACLIMTIAGVNCDPEGPLMTRHPAATILAIALLAALVGWFAPQSVSVLAVLALLAMLPILLTKELHHD